VQRARGAGHRRQPAGRMSPTQDEQVSRPPEVGQRLRPPGRTYNPPASHGSAEGTACRESVTGQARVSGSARIAWARNHDTAAGGNIGTTFGSRQAGGVAGL